MRKSFSPAPEGPAGEASREVWQGTRTGTQASAEGCAAPVGSSSTLPRGATLGRYVVIDRLGEGGMGVVYSAYDFGLDRKVCLKLVRARPRAGASLDRQARLIREAQALARVSHPNVVAVHDVGTFEDQVFIAMELVAGQNLAQWLRERRRTWREVLAAFVQAGRGLHAAHQAGLVHRDFKPENVLVGSDGRLRVTDFGLAVPASTPAADEAGVHEVLPERAPRAGPGTLAYMAPEQRRGEAVGPRSDQFSFCVALYEALYGERPFRGETPQQLAEAIARGSVSEPPAGARVPAWLRRCVLRGLSPEPDKRHESTATLLATLERGRTRVVRRASFAAVATALGAIITIAAVRQPEPSPVGTCAAPPPAVNAPAAWTAPPARCEAPSTVAPVCHPAPSLSQPPALVEPPALSHEPQPAALPASLGNLAPRTSAAPEPLPSWSSEARRLVARYQAEEDDGSPAPVSELLRATLRRLARLLEVSGVLEDDEDSSPVMLATGSSSGQQVTWALIPGQTQPAASGYFSTYYAVPRTTVASLTPTRVASADVQQLELHVATSRTPAESAQARFALARALWTQSGDPDRALFLARQALQTLQSNAVDPELLEEINAWLREKEELRTFGRFSTPHGIER